MVTQNFSSCGKQMLLSSCVYVGFSLQWLLLLWSMVSRAHRLQHLWYISLLAPRYVESSWTRNWTHVPCIGRQIPINCSTRESHLFLFLKQLYWDKQFIELKLRFQNCRFNQLLIENIQEKENIPESSKKQNLNLLHAGNYLHSIYIVFTTIHTTIYILL